MEVGKKNYKMPREDEVVREMIKIGAYLVINCIWKLCNITFENSVLPEDWNTAEIDLLY